MKNILIIALLTLSIVACKDKVKESEGPTQMEQVVAVHDELMPKMSTIARLTQKLEESIDSAQVDSAKIIAIQDLKDANQEMMTWMIDFGNAFDSDEVLDGKVLSEEKVKVLDGYQKSVNELKNSMEAAMTNAEKILNKK